MSLSAVSALVVKRACLRLVFEEISAPSSAIPECLLKLAYIVSDMWVFVEGNQCV